MGAFRGLLQKPSNDFAFSSEIMIPPPEQLTAQKHDLPGWLQPAAELPNPFYTPGLTISEETKIPARVINMSSIVHHFTLGDGKICQRASRIKLGRVVRIVEGALGDVGGSEEEAHSTGAESGSKRGIGAALPTQKEPWRGCRAEATTAAVGGRRRHSDEGQRSTGGCLKLRLFWVSGAESLSCSGRLRNLKGGRTLEPEKTVNEKWSKMITISQFVVALHHRSQPHHGECSVILEELEHPYQKNAKIGLSAKVVSWRSVTQAEARRDGNRTGVAYSHTACDWSTDEPHSDLTAESSSLVDTLRERKEPSALTGRSQRRITGRENGNLPIPSSVRSSFSRSTHTTPLADGARYLGELQAGFVRFEKTALRTDQLARICVDQFARLRIRVRLLSLQGPPTYRTRQRQWLSAPNRASAGVPGRKRAMLTATPHPWPGDIPRHRTSRSQISESQRLCALSECPSDPAMSGSPSTTSASMSYLRTGSSKPGRRIHNASSLSRRHPATSYLAIPRSALRSARVLLMAPRAAASDGGLAPRRPDGDDSWAETTKPPVNRERRSDLARAGHHVPRSTGVARVSLTANLGAGNVDEGPLAVVPARADSGHALGVAHPFGENASFFVTLRETSDPAMPHDDAAPYRGTSSGTRRKRLPPGLRSCSLPRVASADPLVPGSARAARQLDLARVSVHLRGSARRSNDPGEVSAVVSGAISVSMALDDGRRLEEGPAETTGKHAQSMLRDRGALSTHREKGFGALCDVDAKGTHRGRMGSAQASRLFVLDRATLSSTVPRWLWTPVGRDALGVLLCYAGCPEEKQRRCRLPPGDVDDEILEDNA
ncbi:hypothetical protein DFH09DRAFT_1082405 [Mycena vulgaris]|nr:hypothetical protein DFH09DRAFT_1082405 [Mycena vulgaris]